MSGISAVLKDMVWNKYIGAKEGLSECYLRCGTQISKSHFECGHIISRKDNGPNICDNMRPICSKCNKSMSYKNMILFVNTNDLQECPLYIKDFDAAKMHEYTRNIVYPNLTDAEYIKLHQKPYCKYNECNDDELDTESIDNTQSIDDSIDDIDDDSIDDQLLDDESIVDTSSYNVLCANISFNNKSSNKTLKHYCYACEYTTERLDTYKRHLKSRAHITKQRHYDLLGHPVSINPPEDSGIVLDDDSYYCSCCEKVLKKQHQSDHFKNCKLLRAKMKIAEATQLAELKNKLKFCKRESELQLLLKDKELESLKKDMEIQHLKHNLDTKTMKRHNKKYGF